MEPNPQQVPGYFVWDVPGQPVVVQFHLDVVDRLGVEIMRGFGAVPKRGAEVGGILLGQVQEGERPIVRVEAFESVATAYGRGPSYLLSPEERVNFGAAVERARADQKYQAVGYYRSHTRDGAMSLGLEDRETLRQHFPHTTDIVLLVRPFATKVSIGGVLVRKDGEFPPETALEFPFRRREMLGEEAPPRRPLEERGSRGRRPRLEGLDTGDAYDSAGLPPLGGYAEAPPLSTLGYGEPLPIQPPPAPAKRGILWLPLCLLFLLLGVALGYQLALSFAPDLVNVDGKKVFQLDLTAGRVGNSLTVHWDRDSAAVVAAERGVLEILDGEESKTVELNAATLRGGSVVYQNASPQVEFRLVIYLDSNLTVNETVRWQ